MATYNEENKTPATGIVGTVLGGTALAAMSGILGGENKAGVIFCAGFLCFWVK